MATNKARKIGTDTQALRGSCQCGACRYELTGQPVALYACHCAECRKQSASAFGLSLQIRREDLRLVAGTPASWTRGADSGRRVVCRFCPDCGSRLWHEPEPATGLVTVKAGSLDAALDLSGAIHIWTARALPGIVIPPGAERYPEEPPE